jgi:hypothetical protein
LTVAVALKVTHHLAIWACVPLFASGISYSVVSARCLGCSLVVHGYVVLVVDAYTTRMERCSRKRRKKCCQ